MAVESPDTSLGFVLPDISLPDASGELVSVRSEGAAATLIAFVCNHCPYVKHVEGLFGEVASSYMAKGVAIRGIVSNDVESYPEDGPEGMKDQASRAGWTFPYLQDRDQSFAQELGAVCTPDLFLFDRDNVLVYRGAFDESSPKNGVPLTGDHLIRALDFTLEGSEVPLPHRRAIGCSIKWIPQA